MSARLQGKVAIVTGGSKGYGEGIATKFVQEGAKVVIGDVDDTNGAKVASRLDCTFVKADVTQRLDWQSLLDTAVRVYGGLNIVVNNAGYCNGQKPTEEVTDTEFEKLININLKSLFLSSNVILPYFLGRDQPAVFVNIASASARRPRPGFTWYGASKAAIINAVNAMALEYAPRQIRFNSINPAGGLTDMTKDFLSQPETRSKFLETIPMGRLCKPCDVANAACFLASDEADYITGTIIDVDGGRSV
ncbi:hypothetical protein ETB97_005485 [Aspergillus alliaceus]|uniref:Uncharacterized protein n=1 Tax=Petromyces alliaceus TaxID=209559 RepID=A0A5N6FGI7_PETAA|nr:uncharacterized protein BDW43DRAFT_292526 [Aspergillus alliaceus]KAB8227990.1 hypothetical protein BDW43DRAFT_292526 [Aspergillus alliaceus]KAF5857632.1 hypothetical protein ETB97_005485 [Aspergillus burnettii]